MKKLPEVTLAIIAIAVFAYFWRSQIIQSLTAVGNSITGQSVTPINYTNINAPVYPLPNQPLIQYSLNPVN